MGNDTIKVDIKNFTTKMTKKQNKNTAQLKSQPLILENMSHFMINSRK